MTISGLAQTVIPRPLLTPARAIWHALKRRNSPKTIRYVGRDSSVLECCIAYNEYGGYCVPISSSHRFAAQAILKGEVWEPETVKFLCSIGGTIVHAGAYFGDFLPALSKSCDLVFAFEPNRENFRCAEITLRMNGIENVPLLNAGLGEAAGSARLVTRENGVSLGGVSTIAEHGDQVIDVLAIDDVVADGHLSAIHLDIEGYEVTALKGAMKAITRCSPVIVVETEPVGRQVAALLAPLGYEVRNEFEGNTVFHPRNSTSIPS